VRLVLIFCFFTLGTCLTTYLQMIWTGPSWSQISDLSWVEKIRNALRVRGVRVGNWPRHTYLPYLRVRRTCTHDLNLAMIEHQRETRLARDTAISLSLIVNLKKILQLMINVCVGLSVCSDPHIKLWRL